MDGNDCIDVRLDAVGDLQFECVSVSVSVCVCGGGIFIMQWN